MDCPALETPRLIIRPFAQEHLNGGYVDWLNDRELMRYSEQRHREHTLASCRAYWQSFEGSPNCFWAIEAKDMGNIHVGNINAYRDLNNQVVDLGLLIGHAEAGGRGYGQEAWDAVVQHFLASDAIRKVTAGTMNCNGAMLKIMTNAGMVEEGRRRRHYLCRGEEVDIVYFAIFADGQPGRD